MGPPLWMEDAACLDADLDLFFGTKESGRFVSKVAAQAPKKICAWLLGRRPVPRLRAGTRTEPDSRLRGVGRAHATRAAPQHRGRVVKPGVVIVPLPWLTPPLSLNDRDQWRAERRKLDAAKEAARWSIRAVRPPTMPAVAVVLHWRVPDLRRRDIDNMALSLKPALDALVAEGVIPDDDWRHVVHAGQEIHPPDATRRASMWLTVTPAEAR